MQSVECRTRDYLIDTDKYKHEYGNTVDKEKTGGCWRETKQTGLAKNKGVETGEEEKGK